MKEFLNQEDIILCGFNNKSYDDWVVMTMLNGGDPERVKAHNDFIIQGNNGWEYPFIQFKKRPFKSFDLRDDLPINLSLKAIEGNSKANIRESKIDFNIDHKLSKEELEEVIQYCCTDVDNTLELFHSRKNYIDSKYTLAKIKKVDPVEYLPLTNAKITAKFMDAEKVSYDDEFDYDMPPQVNVGKYTHVLEFFQNPVEYTIKQLEHQLETETRKIKIKSLNNKIKRIREEGQYKTSLETTIGGIPTVYGWGGIHGAIPNIQLYEDDEHTMVDIDVGSYYPSMVLEFDYASRAIKDPTLYRYVYNTRIDAKHKGDKEVADALKLILNTFYGAMKNRYNELYDPHMANQICITGQLLLTTLIASLEEVPSVEFIQYNTDGIFVRYHNRDEKEVEKRVKAWETATRLNMEYTIVHSYICKDVNNYIIEQGATYLVNEDGTRTYTKEDKHKIETKGGYVSLYKSGDFKNNSLRVVHKAIVEFFIHHTPIEETILNDNEIEDFQIIAKTGGSYDGTFHIVNGERVDIQRVNRVYATKNQSYGTIYKTKNGKASALETAEEDENGVRVDKIASLPDHCVIDNEYKLTVDEIDKQFYIALALKRVGDYLGNGKMPKNKIKKETKEMANVSVKEQVTAPKNVWQKLIEARAMFLAAPVKKSGKNTYAEYLYFTLDDIVPVATAIFKELGLVLIISFDDSLTIGTLVNTDAPSETIVFTSPMRTLDVKGMNAIQALGGVETYQRRYIYMNVLDIVEADTFDLTQGREEEKAEGSAKAPKELTKKVEEKKSNKPATQEERAERKEALINKDGEATETQIKSIKQGLKKLREKDGDYESYITSCVKTIKAGLTKAQAESLLLEIGEKVAE